MCHPRERINALTIHLDGHGAPLGATTIRCWGTDHEVVQPHGVGPFDTPEEVFARLTKVLDLQFTLW